MMLTCMKADDGDTTDDESREEQIAKMQERKKAAIGRAGSVEGDSMPPPPKRVITHVSRTPANPGPMSPGTGKGPKTGTFAIDPTRATVTVGASGRRITVMPPTKPLEKDKGFWERAQSANTRNISPANSLSTIVSPGVDKIPERPFTAQSTLGSMFNGNLDLLRNNDVSGIAEDLFPAVMRRSDTLLTTTTSTEDSEIEHPDVNMQDFLEIHDSGSDTDGTPSASIMSPVDSGMLSPFTSGGGRVDGTSAALLSHFDQCRGVVGSFRRNQFQAKHFSSLPSHPAKRASASEYNALQKGRRGAANTPMTPARKKRVSQDLTPSGAGVRKSSNSPLVSRRPRSRGNSLVGMANADLYQTLTRNPFE